jgi:GTP-binding protein YchF
MFKPRKLTPADVQYVDVGGMSGSSNRSGLPPALLNFISSADALLHVVRAFEDNAVPHPDGSVDFRRDIESVDLELTFSDLAIIEKRLTKLNAEINKMAGREREQRTIEKDALTRLQTALEAGQHVRDVALTEEESRLLRGYQFLTAKPILQVINVGDDAITAALEVQYNHAQSAVAVISGKIEAELAIMSDEDATVFMEDLGIKEPARNRVINLSYDLLGLMSFLTAGDDECRAWTIRKNTPAAEAAGAIHSDIQRGFIRAEVVAFDDLMKAGDMVAAKKAGTVRLEGKLYIVKDGDICHFLFNV